jgi:hypothetical protein
MTLVTGMAPTLPTGTPGMDSQFWLSRVPSKTSVVPEEKVPRMSADHVEYPSPQLMRT